MRLVRFGPSGQEIPGLLDTNDRLRDARPWVEDWSGDRLAPECLRQLAQRDPSALPLVAAPQRFGPCITGIGKIIGIALNYQAHVAETGAKPTTEPHLFLKATSALCGANDPLPMPRGGSKLDWEVELAVVIGRTGQNIPESAARDHIAGYALLNDISERAFQLEHGGQQHSKGKSAVGFCPLGPWLLTADAVANPHMIGLWTEVNGQRMQDGTTAQMINGVAALVAYCSRFMELQPGDVIATGTPSGVGKAMQPPHYLQIGDTLQCGVSGLGTQNRRVVAPPTA